MNITKYKHFIWDWNGTLVNDTWLCVEITNEMLNRRKIPQITCDDYREQFDFPVINYYRKLGFDLDNEPFEIVGKEFMTEYQSRRFECKLQSKAVEALSIINDLGVGQSVLSAYEHNMLNQIVIFFDISSFFKNIRGLADHSASSKIDNGKELINSLSHDSGETLMIGDTIHDYEVATAIGADCLLVANGHHKKEKLEKCGVKVVESLGNLIEMFGCT